MTDWSAEDVAKCSRCHKRPAEELHACPYQREINDSTDDEYCDCCDECRQGCCDDV